jgi:class 3 adenylate cyclase/tetratricopeptide (TPR) repeat protein
VEMAQCAACEAVLPDAARFCPLCAAPVTTASASEERKLATVMFADLVGSTELGEQDPERTRLLLERFYDAMAAEVVSTGGTVEKFAGDAVMAVFGAPVAQEDHAERSLHAALSMLRRLAELFEGRLQLRIGVNTGEVVVGRPREGSSFATGDAVNVAARLEQAAGPGEILVGSRTVASVRGAFEFEPRQRVDAKGKPGGVDCCRLVRMVATTRSRGVGGLHPVFVGRDSEMGLLAATYQRVTQDQRPHLVTVSANPGVGKSRLLREFWSHLAGQETVPLVRTGHNLAYGQGVTYWALGEILREHLADPESASRSARDPQEVLGLTLGLDPAVELHPLAIRDRLQDAWIGFLSELTATGPVVLLVEDLHWAEEPLLALLELLVRDVPGPLLLLTTTRPELLDTHPSWGHGRNAATVWLEPLSGSAAEELCVQLLDMELPPGLRDVVLVNAEGNPFYVEELLATLIDRGLLIRAGDGWLLGDIDDFVAPDSVQSVLAARIDLLPPAEKSALQVAAVVGRVFWDGPVRALLSGLEPDFVLLEERDFVKRQAGTSMLGQREYSIKHALTREVAYRTLPKARRAHLHAAFAGWLEDRTADQDEHVGLIAHHYAEAVRPEDADLAWGNRPAELRVLQAKAVSWLRRAARAAAARYLVDDALAMLHRAEPLELEPGSKGEIWRAIGEANVLKYAGEEYWEAMLRAVELTTDRVALGEIYSHLAFESTMRGAMWKREPDPALCQSWLDRAIELCPPDSPAYAAALLSKAMRDDDLAAAEIALAIAEAHQEVALISNCWHVLSLIEQVFGGYARALEWARRRLTLVESVTDPDHRMHIYAGLVTAELAAGHVDEAEAYARTGDAIAGHLSPHHSVHAVSGLLAVAEAAARWERIRELQERVETVVAANVDTPCVSNARVLLTCAVACAELGLPGEATRLEASATALGLEGYGFVLDALHARLAILRGDIERLPSLLADSEKWLSASSSYVHGAATRLEALLAADRPEEAEAEALSLRFSQQGTYLYPFGLRALAVVRRDLTLLDRAVASFAALGLVWHAERAADLRPALAGAPGVA